jgi:hypothetical protein
LLLMYVNDIHTDKTLGWVCSLSAHVVHSEQQVTAGAVAYTMESLYWHTSDNSNTLHLTFTYAFTWINIVNSFNSLSKENAVLSNCIFLEHITSYIQDDVSKNFRDIPSSRIHNSF